MLRISVELVPAGIESLGRQIASATIGNIGGTPLHADYRYRLASEASPYAPALSHESVVTGMSANMAATQLVSSWPGTALAVT